MKCGRQDMTIHHAWPQGENIYVKLPVYFTTVELYSREF